MSNFFKSPLTNKINLPPPPTVFFEVGRSKLKPGSELPPKPFSVDEPNFLTQGEISEIKEKIEETLRSFDEVTFEYIPKGYFWGFNIIQGSFNSNNQIRLYCNGDEQTVIAGNRMSGDSLLFHRVFEEIKAK